MPYRLKPMRTLRNLLKALQKPALLLGCWLCANSVFATEVDGFTEPYRDCDVAAAEMGRIERLYVKEGDRVKAGQLLAQLEDAPLVAALKVAEAEKNAKGRLSVSKQELLLQTEVFERLNQLKERNHANPLEVVRAKSQSEIALNQLQTVEEELRVRELEYERLIAQLENRKVYAPIDGTIAMVLKDQSEFTSPSDPAIFKIVAVDPLLVVFPVPAMAARKLSKGQSVNVSVEGISAKGTVENVAIVTDAQSGTNRVRIRIDNPNEEIPCGASCILSLDSEPSSQLTATP